MRMIPRSLFMTSWFLSLKRYFRYSIYSSKSVTDSWSSWSKFDILHRNPGKGRIFLVEEIKERHAGHRHRRSWSWRMSWARFRGKVSAEWRQVFYQIAQPQNVFPVYLFMV